MFRTLANFSIKTQTSGKYSWKTSTYSSSCRLGGIHTPANDAHVMLMLIDKTPWRRKTLLLLALDNLLQMTHLHFILKTRFS